MAERPTTSTAPLCHIQAALGRVEPCPETACPFWEAGGAALAGRCAVERLDLGGRPALAAWLLQIRKQLEAAKARDGEDEARRLFYRWLDAGELDGG